MKRNTYNTLTNENYPKDRVRQIGINYDDVKKYISNCYRRDFSKFVPNPDKLPSIWIEYCDITGNPIFYRSGEGPKRFARIRANPFYTKFGKCKRYSQPSGAGVQPYLVGLWLYFISKGVKSIPHLIITEGELKALSGCFNGFPVSGAGGVNNIVTTHRELLCKEKQKGRDLGFNKKGRVIDAEFPKLLKELFVAFGVKKITMLYDSDIINNLNDEARAMGTFYSSLKYLKMAIDNWNKKKRRGHKKLSLNFAYIKTPSTGEKLGLDDLLQKYPNEVEAIKKELLSGTGKDYFNVLSIGSAYGENNSLYLIKIFLLASVYGDHPRLESYFNKKTTVYTSNNPKVYASDIVANDITEGNFFWPTGSGKSSYFANVLKGKRIAVCPTQILVKGYVKKGAIPYMQGSRNLTDFFTGAREMIATTYQSLPRLLDELSELAKDTICFNDECHAYITNLYTGDAMPDAMYANKFFKSRIFATGTMPLTFNPALINDQYILKKPTASKNLYYLLAKDTMLAAANQFMESASNGKKVVLILNDKGAKLSKLKTLLGDCKFKVINADTKSDPVYKMLAELEVIDKDFDGLIITSVIKEGNNILDKEHFDFVFCGSFHSAEINQIVARPRTPLSVTTYIIKSTERKTTNSPFNPCHTAYGAAKSAYKLASEFNATSECDEDILEKEEKFWRYLSVEAISKKNGIVTLDFFKLDNFVFKRQTTEENRNDTLMIKNLAQYGFVFKGYITSFAEMTSQQNKSRKEANEKRKESNLELFNKAIEHLETCGNPVSECENLLRYQSNELTSIEKKVFKTFAELADALPDANMIQVLKSTENSPSKINILRLRILFGVLMNNEQYQKECRKLFIILKALQSAFTVGQDYTGDEIREKVVKVFNLDSVLEKKAEYRVESARKEDGTYQNSWFIKIANCAYNLERQYIKVDGAKVYFYPCEKITYLQSVKKSFDTANMEKAIKLNEYGYPACWG